MKVAVHRNSRGASTVGEVMTKRLLLPIVLLGTLVMAAPASAAFTVGISEQSPNMFNNQLWKDLKLKKVRYLVPWNTASDPAQLNEVRTYMTNARVARQEVFVHFTAIRGCYQAPKYSKSKQCRAPSVREYAKAFRAFRKEFRFVKVYGAWNEANHVSQPVYKNPKRAADYYTALKRACKKCKIVAGDLLDSSNMAKYARTMNKRLKGRARLWGLHNYSDVNRRRSRKTAELLKIVPGEVWMTETGGIVKFTDSPLKPTEAKAVKAVNYMFSLANKFDSRRRGNRSRITRLYPYDFGPSSADARFDASLLAPDGTARKTYDAFKKKARRARR